MSQRIATCLICGIEQQTKIPGGYICSMCKPPVRFGRTPCQRCGRTRRADNRHPTLCGHCAREPEHVLELTGGHWERQGLIYKWIPAPTASPCGTDRGYDRHRNHGEPVCDDCREAHRIKRAEQRAAQRQEVA